MTTPFVYTDQADVGAWREASYGRNLRRPRLDRKGKKIEEQFEYHEEPSSRSWGRDDDLRD